MGFVIHKLTKIEAVLERAQAHADHQSVKEEKVIAENVLKSGSGHKRVNEFQVLIGDEVGAPEQTDVKCE